MVRRIRFITAIPYRPGSPQLVFCTFTLAAAAANLRQRVGYFDADDGVITDYDTGAATSTGTAADGVQSNSMGPTSTVFGTVDPNNTGGLVVSGGMNTITVAKVTSTRRDDGSDTGL